MIIKSLEKMIKLLDEIELRGYQCWDNSGNHSSFYVDKRDAPLDKEYYMLAKENNINEFELIFSDCLDGQYIKRVCEEFDNG